MKELLRCKTCLKKANAAKCWKLTPETIFDGKKLLEMLKFCVPELVVDITLESALCRKCLKSLNKLYNFKNMCLKNDIKYYKDNSQKKNVPFTDSNISKTKKVGNTTSDVNNRDIDTDVNQNETPEINSPSKNQTISFKQRVKKKRFLCYRKRFTNSNCFGCRNRIRDVKYHNNEVSDNYVCLTCEKIFTSIGEMRRHAYSHIYLCKCKICGKKWRDAYQLTLHLRSHSKQKPFECPECNKRFVQSYNLHQHLATHKGEKDNQNRCEICGKILSTKYNLKIHMTTHNIGVKPRCPMCNKWFYTQAAMIKHSETCIVVKEENEIFLTEPEFIKNEIPNFVKEESEDEDDEFIEGELFGSISDSQQIVINNLKTDKFIKEEDYNCF